MADVDPNERPPDRTRNVPHDRRDLVESRFHTGRCPHRDEAPAEDRSIAGGDDLGRATGEVRVPTYRLDADALEGVADLRAIDPLPCSHCGDVVPGGDAPAREAVREQVDERGGDLAVGVRVEPAVVDRGVDRSDRVGDSVVEPPADAFGGQVESVAHAHPTGVRVRGGVVEDAAVVEDLLPRIRVHAIAVGSRESLGRGLHERCLQVSWFDLAHLIFEADTRASNYISRAYLASNNQLTDRNGRPFHRWTAGFKL